MAKKIKILDPQKKKLFTMIGEILSGTTYVPYEIDFVDLLREIKYNNAKNIRKIRNYNNYYFIKSNLDGNDGLMSFIIMDFPIKDKDSIKLNDGVVKVVDFFEKLFIDLDNVTIYRHNDFITNTHYILVKIFKNMNSGVLRSIKLETVIEGGDFKEPARKIQSPNMEFDDYADYMNVKGNIKN